MKTGLSVNFEINLELTENELHDLLLELKESKDKLNDATEIKNLIKNIEYNLNNYQEKKLI